MNFKRSSVSQKIICLLMSFAVFIAFFPAISVTANNLSNGQILADGIYFIRNAYSDYYMHVFDELPVNDNIPVSHMIKSNAPHYMWKIQYLGNGAYSIHSMQNLNFLLSTTTQYSFFSEPVAVVRYFDTTTGTNNNAEEFWTIEQDSNGYVFKYCGLESETLYAPNINRSAEPYLITSDYDENVLNCHWILESPNSNMVFYGSDMQPTRQPDIVINIGDTITFGELGVFIQTYPDIYSNEKITWSSSNERVAVIDPDTGTITANGYGHATIAISCTINGHLYSASYIVSVVLPFGQYYINNRSEHLYLDILQDNSITGGQVLVSDLQGESIQNWYISYDTTTASDSTEYHIYTNLNGRRYYLIAQKNAETRKNELVLTETLPAFNDTWTINTRPHMQDSYSALEISCRIDSYRYYLNLDKYSSMELTLSINTQGPTTWTMTQMMPLSGYELDYAPYLWSGPVSSKCNCYAYAINNQLDKRGNLWYKQQPGAYEGSYKLTSNDYNTTGETIISATAADFSAFSKDNNQEMIFIKVDKYEKCPEGTYKVALAINKGEDYHWYRQDSDGLWSHKQGTTPVKRTDASGNLIIDPQTADRGDYTYFIGYFAVTPWNRLYISDMSISEVEYSEYGDTTDSLITIQQLNQISIGMSYEQVIDILGATGIDVGSGAILMQYCVDGNKSVLLNYCENSNGELILMNILEM